MIARTSRRPKGRSGLNERRVNYATLGHVRDVRVGDPVCGSSHVVGPRDTGWFSRWRGQSRLMMSTWRYLFDVLVVGLSAWTVLIGITLLRPPHQVARRWISHTAAWIGGGMLLLRGIAGMIVDGRSDPIWWRASRSVASCWSASPRWLESRRRPTRRLRFDRLAPSFGVSLRYLSRRSTRRARRAAPDCR